LSRRRMPGQRKMRDDPWAWLSEDWLSDEDMLRYAGKWIVATEGKVRGVGRTLDAALRRANLPDGVEPFVWRVPPPALIF